MFGTQNPITRSTRRGCASFYRREQFLRQQEMCGVSLKIPLIFSRSVGAARNHFADAWIHCFVIRLIALPARRVTPLEMTTNFRPLYFTHS